MQGIGKLDAGSGAIPPQNRTAPTSAPEAATDPVDKLEPALHHPQRIILIRHGEKPDPNGPAPLDPTALSPAGELRAKALAEAIPILYPQIDYLFATAPNSHSHRPLQTIIPLSKALNLPITPVPDDQELATMLEVDPKYAGKTVLICWHHHHIPQLTEDLHGSPPLAAWPDKSFDRIWQLDYKPDGTATVSDLPEHILPGDAAS